MDVLDEPTPHDRSGPETHDEWQEELYERFLDETLAGAAPDAVAFVAEHAPGCESLLRRLQAVQQSLPDRADPGQSSSQDRLPFDRLGDHRVLERIADGGMGVVYLAVQESLDRFVALKVIRPEFLGSPRAVERFRREARALARLEHPHILKVHGYGEQDSVRFLVMEYVKGRPLDEILEEWRSHPEHRSPLQAVRWVEQIAAALDHAHGAGLVHRDVKPANIHVRPNGDALLLDFGLVRDVQHAGTITQQFMGSPAYASPEQLDPGQGTLNHRSDLYSLGSTLYECLTLRVPFEGASLEDVMRRALTHDPLPPREHDRSISRDLNTVVMKAMEKDPERRYQTATELAADLRAVRELRPVTARAPGPVDRVMKAARRNPPAALAILASVTALLVLAAWQLHSWRTDREARRQQAREHVALARDVVEKYEEGSAELVGLESRRQALADTDTTRNLDDEENREWDRVEGRIGPARRELESLIVELSYHLREAERLDPEGTRARAVWADLYAAQWRAAASRRDYEDAARLARLVTELDDEGVHADEVSGRGVLKLTTDPTGATVCLYRFRLMTDVNPEGEFRLVPVPEPAPEPPHPVAPGQVVLRVLADHGDWRRNDLIVEVDGHAVEGTFFILSGNEELFRLDRLVAINGAKVEQWHDILFAEAVGRARDAQEQEFSFETADGDIVDVLARTLESVELVVGTAQALFPEGDVPVLAFRNGRLQSCTAPEGLRVRPTAIPLMAPSNPSARITADEAFENGVELPFGEYVGLVRHPEFAETRFTFVLDHEQRERTVSVKLPRASEELDGFVHIPDGPDGPFWIMDHEVTFEQYLECLNTLDLSMLQYPDHHVPVASEVYLEAVRREGGRFALGDGVNPRHPVAGLAWHGVRGYAEWRTLVGEQRGSEFEFRLPTFQELQFAARGWTRRSYVYGDRFRGRWNNTATSHRYLMNPVQAAMYARDESPYGVFDLSGNVGEWTSDYSKANEQTVIVTGGAWAFARSALSDIANHREAAWELPRSDLGFRLVAVPKERDR